MNNTLLDFRLRKHACNGFGKALEYIDAGNENVFHAPVRQVRQDRLPEPGPFLVADPQAEGTTGALDSLFREAVATVPGMMTLRCMRRIPEMRIA